MPDSVSKKWTALALQVALPFVGVSTPAISPTPAWAQSGGGDVRFGSSPNPVGSGARALGSGSAFIATADDATAASWNPAGLMALEVPEVSLVLDLRARREAFEGWGVSAADAEQSTLSPGVNYFSAAYPFQALGRSFVASLNFQSMIDFDTKQTGVLRFAQDGTLRELSYDVRQEGALSALTPALSFQLLPNLALGLSLNIWTSKLGYRNGWREKTRTTAYTAAANGALLTSVSEARERFVFDGFGAVAGALWDVTPKITLGGVFKTPTWGTAARRLRQSSQLIGSDGNPLGDPGTYTTTYEEPMRWPLSYGAGVAYRHSDAFTVSADIYRTEWGQFRRRQSDPSGTGHMAINPISGERYKDATVGGITQAHLGGEYLFILDSTVIPVRAGLHFDQEPHAGSNNDFFGLALGTGASIFDDIIVDVAYQLRWGPDVNPSVITAPKRTEGTYILAREGSVLQHQLYLSVIYHLP